MKEAVFYLDAENWEGCDVYLTNQNNRLWLAVCTDDNYGVGYVDARQLYEELKEYFDGEDQIDKVRIDKEESL